MPLLYARDPKADSAPCGGIIQSFVKDSDAQPPAAKQEEPMLYCPRCSTRLAQLKCKLVCPQCGYYMSCADYY
jgi:methionyl-tRNA synthetase